MFQSGFGDEFGNHSTLSSTLIRLLPRHVHLHVAEKEHFGRMFKAVAKNHQLSCCTKVFKTASKSDAYKSGSFLKTTIARSKNLNHPLTNILPQCNQLRIGCYKGFTRAQLKTQY